MDPTRVNEQTALDMIRGQILKLCQELNIHSTVTKHATEFAEPLCQINSNYLRSMNLLASTAVYTACRLNRTCHTCQQITGASGCKRKMVFENFRRLILHLGLKVPIADPNTCILKIANRLDVSVDATKRAGEILEEAKTRKITMGKLVMGIAAAAVYLACLLDGKPVTQRAVAEVTDVSEVTVRNHFKWLMDIVNVKLPIEVRVSELALAYGKGTKRVLRLAVVDLYQYVAMLINCDGEGVELRRLVNDVLNCSQSIANRNIRFAKSKLWIEELKMEDGGVLLRTTEEGRRWCLQCMNDMKKSEYLKMPPRFHVSVEAWYEAQQRQSGTHH